MLDEDALLRPEEPRKPNVKSTIIKVIIFSVVIIYTAVGFYAAGFLTQPVRDFSSELTPAIYQLSYEDVTITARIDQMPIAGWFIPADSDRAVIMVHGRNQSRTSELYGRFVELASYLHQKGLNILMIDLRGHGQSPEAHNSFGLVERRDVEGAADWLLKRGFKEGSIGALGISAGGAAVIGAAAEETSISAVVEESAFSDLNPILRAQWKSSTWLPSFFLPPTLWMVHVRYGYYLTRARPVAEIEKIAPRPLLIIHSTTDESVPVENAYQLKAAYPQAETWILTGPEHARSFNAGPEEYVQKVSEFFNRNLK